MRAKRYTLAGIALASVMLLGSSCPFGLSLQGFIELDAAGVNKYIGQFQPASSEDIGLGWTRHTYDPDGGNGPICIAGTPFTVFTKINDPHKVLFFEQGGGACWQDFYNCTVEADQFPPPFSPLASGIWVDSFDTGTEVIDNPFADWSVVYVPYCDGSVFSGDNDVVDPAWQAFIEGEAGLPPGLGPPVRFHRGLRNMTAAMDLAKATFPDASRLVISGSSAGGVGAAGFTPFVARFEYGNFIKLTVLNDAGPIAVNLDDTEGIAARAADWQFGQFYPASCTECDPLGQATEPVKWRLENDKGIREGFYSTDADAINRFFLDLLPPGATQEDYRELIVTEHGLIRDVAPTRYKRFIRSGDDEHTAFQLPTFYTGEIDGIPLYKWTDSVVNKLGFKWRDLVEDFIPIE